jgi:glycosyltransferase involved in cell wall biosynthesis
MLGGGEIYVSELIRAFPDHRHIVFQLSSGDTGSELRHVRPWKKPFKSFRTALQVQYPGELMRQDLLISHDLNNLLPLFAAKTIAISHSVTWTDPGNEGANRRNRRKACYAYLKARGLVANSTAFFREMGLSEVLPGTRFFEQIEQRRWLIPNCIDLEMFTTGQPVSAIVEMKALLLPRRVDRGRGIGLAVEAFQFIQKRLPYLKLLIVGAIGSLDYLQELEELLQKLGLAGKVFFTGRVPHKLMPDFYRSSLGTLIPTLHTEGTALGALESMACGCATFSTDVGGLADLPTVKVSVEPAAMAEEIAKNLHQANDIGQAQRDAVRKSFSREKWIEAWGNVIRTCLG